MIALKCAHSKMKLSFTQWLKLVRENAGLSQQAIADALGVKVQTVGNWESGRTRPTLDLDHAETLCRLLNVSLETAARAYRGELEVND